MGLTSMLSALSLRRIASHKSTRHIQWPHVIASGALWSVVYNFVWGVAWFAVMRDEWQAACVAVKRPIPWTGEVWFGWGVITVIIGVAMMAYAAAQSRSAIKSSIYAGLALWVVLSVGFTLWGRQSSFSIRVLAFDALVNLVGLLAGSLVGAWSQFEC